MSKNLAAEIIRATADRLGIAVPEDVAARVAALGPRPRIGAILDSRAAVDDKTILMIGSFVFYPGEHRLVRDENDIRLTEKERDILLALLQAEGRTIDRRTMLEKVWGYASGVETHTLETHIYRLRQKIETDPANPVILVTDGDSYSLA